MLPGETLLTGAPVQCPDCHQTPTLGVFKSAAGYYIGSFCACGPYTRESGYYKDKDEAVSDWEEGTWVPR